MFGAVSGLRGAFYDRGWLPRERVDAPVISVGNLTAGGTGKTPMVAWLARELIRRGLRPGIVSRGYRKRGQGAETGAGPNDEALELAAALGDVPHEQNPDRAEAARALLGAVDVIVLDDGFQHRRLARDLDLVLVDATRPWGLAAADGGEPVRALLPRGLLREHPGALARADALCLTRCDQVAAAQLDALERELERSAPGVPLLRAEHRPVRLREVGPGGAVLGLETLAGASVRLVSGIGHPAAFEATVAGLGATVVEHRRFPDHHAYTAEQARALLADPEGTRARLITTAKDAVKLGALLDADGDLGSGGGVRGARACALEVELELTAGAPVLAALLDALPESRARRERRTLHEGLHG